MSIPVKVSFADLTHTGQLVATNTFPLGIAYVATYAKRELGNEIQSQVFRYPDDFSEYLETNTPQIACFSAFSWNVRLAHEYARKIKSVSPQTIVVFGGPNFPSARDEQQDFLTKFSAIDCYFEFEGEIPFVEFFNAMKAIDFDWEMFKETRTVVSNIRYLADDEMVMGDLAPRVRDLDDLPSPYMTGVADKFFDDVLIPMLQNTRGCPYTCTFCWEGGSYFQKVPRFSQERITSELRYISERVGQVPDLIVTDANFGMFQQDLETAQEIATIRANHKQSWPKSILSATAKNHKERTVEIVGILGDSMQSTAAVQSTDDTVLNLIRRKNVSLDALVTFAQSAGKHDGQTEADIILCLEGDTKEAHFKTIKDMLDAKMTVMCMHQYMMLPGTQSSSKATREEYQLQTRFRVLPRCFGSYVFRGESFPAAEIEEITIANTTMPYDDYQVCRDLHLTVEIFHNDSIFLELLNFLDSRQIDRSKFILSIHDYLLQSDGVLSSLYAQFREEEKRNLWESLEPVESFVQEEGVIERYIDGEFGTNELRKYRAVAIFRHIEEMHQVAFMVARSLLRDQGQYSDEVDHYLEELCQFSLMRKLDILGSDRTERREFHFDFLRLVESKFTIDPFEVVCPDGIGIEFYHSEPQQELLNGYISQYGTGLIGLGRLIVRANMNRLYRNARYSGAMEHGRSAASSIGES